MGDKDTEQQNKGSFAWDDIHFDPQEIISALESGRTPAHDLLEQLSSDPSGLSEEKVNETLQNAEEQYRQEFSSALLKLPANETKLQEEMHHTGTHLDQSGAALDQLIRTLSMGLRLRWVQSIDLEKRRNTFYEQVNKTMSDQGKDPQSAEAQHMVNQLLSHSLQSLPTQVQSLHFPALDDIYQKIQSKQSTSRAILDSYKESLSEFNTVHATIQNQQHEIRQEIQAEQELINKYTEVEQHTEKEQQQIAESVANLSRFMSKIEQNGFESLDEIKQLFDGPASDALENIVSDDNEYTRGLHAISTALDRLPLEAIQDYQTHAKTFFQLQEQKEEIQDKARSHLNELATLFTTYKEQIKRGTASVESITEERKKLLKRIEDIDSVYEQYLHSVHNLAQKVGISPQQDIHTLQNQFEHSITTSIQSLIAAHAPTQQNVTQGPSLHLAKGLSSADEEYAAHVAALMLRFADIEIAEDRHWQKVKEMDKRLQTFYRMALPLPEQDAGYQPFQEELHFREHSQSKLFSIIQELIDKYESSTSISSQVFADIDKNFQKVIGPDIYKKMYEQTIKNEDELLEASRYTPLVKNPNLRKRILLFEQFDQYVQQEGQRLNEEISIRKDATKSPLHLFFELMYPKMRNPSTNLTVETENGFRTNLAMLDTAESRGKENLASVPLFSEYGFPESHYQRDKKNHQLSYSQFFIDLRRLAQVTYFMLTTSHHWLSLNSITNRYIDDFREHKIQGPSRECDRITEQIGRLASKNTHDPQINMLERRREQLTREIKKYEDDIPPGIHFTPIQRVYFHLTQHLRPEHLIRYQVLHPTMDAERSKLRLYNKSFRDIRNKIEDRLTLRNVYTKGQVPETDLRLLTETLRQYI